MAGKVRVIEKNEGEKIEWRQSGAKLCFGDDDLIIRCDTRQREYPVHVDICADEDGNLVTGVSKNSSYVAQIDIPAYSYTEPEEPGEGEAAQPEREIQALNMNDVVLTLWNVERLKHMGALL